MYVYVTFTTLNLFLMRMRLSMRIGLKSSLKNFNKFVFPEIKMQNVFFYINFLKLSVFKFKFKRISSTSK